MNRRRQLWLLLLCVAASPGAQAQEDGLQLNISNTLRAESYSVHGDPTSGPYAYPGGQYYDELSINAQQRFSAYDVLRLQFYGVANDSSYRSKAQGLVPERFNVTRENGDAETPYRLEVGDYFSAFSYRTLQRSLRGAQLELQPQQEAFGARHSLVFSAGINPVVPGLAKFDWRNARDQDQVVGASWLMEFGPRTRLSANLVHDDRRGDATLGTLERSQNLFGAAAETGWDWGTQKLKLESELATVKGDHDGSIGANGTIAPGSGVNRRGQALFAQLSGMASASPLDYRLRVERYDRDYRPAEAIIAADHSGAEAHLGWRFNDGLSWRTRFQRFVDGLQSGNDLRTNTVGTTLAGPLGAGVSGSADLFWQDIVKQDRSVDRGTVNLNTGLSRPLTDGWIGNLGLNLQDLRDRVAGAQDSTSEQLQFGGSHALAIGGWTGSVSPGIRWRHATGDVLGVREWAPQLGAMLSSGSHSLAANYGYQRLSPAALGTPTVEVNALRVDYRYSSGPHTLGLELSAYDRRVTIGLYNDSYRASAYWTYAFERNPARPGAKPLPAPSQAGEATLAPNLSLLVELAPGGDFDRAMSRLAQAGIGGASRQGNSVIFELRVLADLPQRQRLVIEHSAGSITRSALLIDFAEPTAPAQVVRDYEQVRRALLDRFGPSSSNVEDGQIGASFVADLNMNRVVRAMEWTTAAGTLRLGIPRRLDGQARIEIQHGASFASPRDALWSMEAVR